MVDTKKLQKEVEELMMYRTGAVCRGLREAFGLTQMDIAELLECSAGTISRAEHDEPSAKKWTDAEFEFFSRCMNVLSEHDRDEVGAVVGIALCVRPKTVLLGLQYKRRYVK